MTKQVIVVRRVFPNGNGGTYKPRIGKLMAQAAHASLDVFLNRAETDLPSSYISWKLKNSQEYKWIDSGRAKICVYVDTEQELLEIFARAREQNILCSIVVDSGKTEFHGKEMITACAIGPDDNEKIDKITGHLKLL